MIKNEECDDAHKVRSFDGTLVALDHNVLLGHFSNQFHCIKQREFREFMLYLQAIINIIVIDLHPPFTTLRPSAISGM